MPRPENTPEKTLANLMSKTVVDEEGCRLWTGLTDKSGYSRTTYKKKPTTVHALIWFLETGEWPTTDEPLDHECHNKALQARTCQGGPTCKHRRCVELEHLIQTTRAENTANGMIGQRRFLRLNCRRCDGLLTEADREHKASRRMGFCRTCRRLFDRDRASNYRKAKTNA